MGTINEMTAALRSPQPSRRAAAAAARTVARAAKKRADASIPEGCADWVRWAWSGAEGTERFHAWWALEEEARKKASSLE
tara:strand:+ start:119 stop:358 length:240 start_codon:yes stop_codon:yes gene_type:complete